MCSHRDRKLVYSKASPQHYFYFTSVNSGTVHLIKKFNLPLQNIAVNKLCWGIFIDVDDKDCD
jgi:hypothetical protein